MSERDTPLPLSFRADLLNQVMPALQAGECCSLVGASGVGKSNLVRFLQRPDVLAAYWGDEPAWVVLVDTNGLVFGEHSDEFVLAELMIHRLIREAERHQMPAELIADLDQKYSTLLDHPSAHLALRYLERSCARICETCGVRLVFVFDQFEDLWTTRDARLFLNLRHLRDEFKYQLSYLVITRERLQPVRQHARDDLTAVESFWELFTSHVYGLGVYSDDDANDMLDRIARRRGIVVDAPLRDMALAASGRHPSLLRAVFWALHQAREIPTDVQALLHVGTVAEECGKIWSSLLPDEHQSVRMIAANLPQKPEASSLVDLQLKQLVLDPPLRVFSPLFAAYALSQPGEDITGIIVAPRLRQVWLNGQPLAKLLAPLEFALLEHLARHSGEVCRREDVLRHLYGDQVFDANDERLDTLLRRLRETLGEDARNPLYLFTHRGVGVRLMQGRIQE